MLLRLYLIFFFFLTRRNECSFFALDLLSALPSGLDLWVSGDLFMRVRSVCNLGRVDCRWGLESLPRERRRRRLDCDRVESQLRIERFRRADSLSFFRIPRTQSMRASQR